MGVLGVLLALSTIFIWGRLVNIDYDLKDISEELKKMNERRNDENRYLFRGKRIDNGEWVVGHFYEFMDKSYIFYHLLQVKILLMR